MRMSALFFTQTKSLEFFYELYLRLKKKNQIKKAGFYVAGFEFYQEFLKKVPQFEQEFTVLKEWEIVKKAKQHQYDLKRISKFETQMGDPTLWTPLIADRRIYFGKGASLRPDYKSNRPWAEQLNLLDIGLLEVEQLFESVKPDWIASIYTATFGDCLGHMFANARKLNAFDIRSTRIQNYVFLSDGIPAPSSHFSKIRKEFETFLPKNVEKLAVQYLREVKAGVGAYEGAVVPNPDEKNNIPSRILPIIRWVVTTPRILGAIPRLGRRFFQSYTSPYKYDFQYQPVVRSLLYAKVLNPLNAWFVQKRLSHRVVSEGDLKSIDYALYPLHTEPELVLAQFARPYLNQLEVIRNISQSLPVGKTLLVKEHPMMVGKRKLSYYEKILRLPNVKLMKFDLTSATALNEAKLVFVLRGAIGLEAVIRKIPVIALAKSQYDLLPSKMYRQCRDLFKLPDLVKNSFENYEYDEAGLLVFLSTMIKGSVKANLISDLLGKQGRHRGAQELKSHPLDTHPHMDILADHFIERINGIKSERSVIIDSNRDHLAQL